MSAVSAAAVADAHRREWARVLAATVRVTRDLDLAEECVQDACARALTAWRDGIPASPAAWLTTTARNLALDDVRRSANLRGKLPLLVESAPTTEPSVFPDDRLRLVFTCCHPALGLEARTALTLRLLCGLTTIEVARVFLVPEPTMAARLTRAKKKIVVARIPYRVPPLAALPSRIDTVLTVVHLLFTAGHTAATGPSLQRPDLVERALDLARMLRRLLPEDADVAGLLGLILLTDARRETRLGEDGRLLLLEEQDRSAWDRAAIAEGVALNRAVAIGLADGPASGLAALEPLIDEVQLARYPYLAAARADFLRRLGRARIAYEEAILLTDNDVERSFLRRRVANLSTGSAG